MTELVRCYACHISIQVIPWFASFSHHFCHHLFLNPSFIVHVTLRLAVSRKWLTIVIQQDSLVHFGFFELINQLLLNFRVWLVKLTYKKLVIFLYWKRFIFEKCQRFLDFGKLLRLFCTIFCLAIEKWGFLKRWTKVCFFRGLFGLILTGNDLFVKNVALPHWQSRCSLECVLCSWFLKIPFSFFVLMNKNTFSFLSMVSHFAHVMPWIVSRPKKSYFSVCKFIPLACLVSVPGIFFIWLIKAFR